MSPWTGKPLPANSSIARARAKELEAVKKRQDDSLPDGLTLELSRILRPQAAYRWLPPQLSAITPQYIEMVLRGALAGSHVQAWELFDLMHDTWPELGAAFDELVNRVLRRKILFEPWRDEEEEPSESALERARVVSAALRQMKPEPSADENGLRGTFFDILDSWIKCTTVIEVDWHIVRNKKLGDLTAPRATFWVHPVCYAWDMEGRLGLRRELGLLRYPAGQRQRAGEGWQPAKPVAPMPGVWQSTTMQPRPSNVDPFPKDKFIVAIHKAKSGNALGGALLRELAWWWCAANFSAEWLMNYAQLFGMPIRWANYPTGATDATIKKLCDMLENMGSRAWGTFPVGTELNLIESSKGATSLPQVDLIDRANRYVRLRILGQTTTGSADISGSMAKAKVGDDVTDNIADAAADFVCEVMEQLINAILRQNYGDEDEAPKMTLTEEEDYGLSEAQVVQTLAGAGLEFKKSELYARFGYTQPSKDDETIGGKPTPGQAASPFGNPNPDDIGQDDDNAPEAKDDGQTDKEKDAQDVKAGKPVTAASSASDLESNAAKELAKAVAQDWQPIANRLTEVLTIQDPEVLRTRLQALLKDWDGLAADVAKDPEAASVLEKLTAAALANGLQKNAK